MVLGGVQGLVLIVKWYEGPAHPRHHDALVGGPELFKKAKCKPACEPASKCPPQVLGASLAVK